MLMAGESGVAYPEFQTGARVIDLLVVDERSLRGYEIKAATDRVTDGRFQWQFDQYRLRCELLTYAVAPKFTDHCLQHLPEWVGVITVHDGYMVVEREPQPNPDIETRHMLRMLWKPEATAKVKELGLYYRNHWRCPDCHWSDMGRRDAPSRKCGNGLGRMLAEHLDDTQARLYVRRCIMHRVWGAIGGRPRRRYEL